METEKTETTEMAAVAMSERVVMMTGMMEGTAMTEGTLACK
jgi:hypothetical protein